MGLNSECHGTGSAAGLLQKKPLRWFSKSNFLVSNKGSSAWTTPSCFHLLSWSLDSVPMDSACTGIVAVTKKELCGKLVHTVSETPNAPSLGETRECGVRSPIAPKGDMIVIMLVQGA